MKIETIGYIYKLLVDDKGKCDADFRAAYKAAYKLKKEYEARSADIESQTDAVREYKCKLQKARDALEDFESHDWH